MMKLKELLRSAGYEVSDAIGEIEVSGISSDSRRVAQGNVFVAIRGLHADGYVHIGEAISRGAVFVVAERRVAGIPSLVVGSARAALSRLFDAWYGHPAANLSLIGITGTNGKTSTLSMLEAILLAAGHTCGVIGTVAARCNGQVISAPNADKLANMTTPDPAELYRLLADMRDAGARYVLMEVTSHALCFDKVEPLFFKRAVFTNLTPDHLDLHGDMAGYFMEKRKLFSRCEMGVISLFGAYGQSLSDSITAPFLTVGRGNVTKVLANGATGVCFTLLHEGEAIELSLPVPGDFSVENAALAAMTALSLGVEAKTVRAALADFGGVCGRMERVAQNDLDISVFLDYAHTPDALEKLLLSVRRFRLPRQRIILLFGCGGDRDRSKRRKMGRIATRLADLTVITSDNPRSESPSAIIADIVKGIDKEKPYKIIEDRREAIAFAVNVARPGDILLLAGKGHEEYEIRGRERLAFSERDIVTACMAEKQREFEA
ncbi:MAG: UDP-N-acetylmuramoyl-L-alanyl-D-glutamate--2,6-diaminopimelate ligase [Clostridia bacterium]|nr:UDP-N-acetylmuramoyl-L-alanyl-D-glutamate--2,6-diaminopimelate ligase [Clostridia bacterium]